MNGKQGKNPAGTEGHGNVLAVCADWMSGPVKEEGGASDIHQCVRMWTDSAAGPPLLEQSVASLLPLLAAESGALHANVTPPHQHM